MLEEKGWFLGKDVEYWDPDQSDCDNKDWCLGRDVDSWDPD